MPGKYVEKIDHYAEKIHPRLVTIASKVQLDEDDKPIELVSRQGENTSADSVQSSAVEKAPLEPKLAEVEPEQPAENVVSDKDVSKEQQVVADMAMADVPVAEEEKPQAVTNNVITEQPAEKDKITSTVSISDEKPADNQQVPATDKEAAGASSLLREARSAFNKGELDVSIAKYNELIELENDEADFYGELGNVHYAMGSWDKAGVAYYEAATRLIEAGQLAQVGYLQRVLQGLDAERAEKLTKQMAKINQGM